MEGPESALEGPLFEAAPTSEAAAHHRRRKGGAFLMTVLATVYGLAYYDRILMVVLSQSVKAEFGLSDKALSILSGLSFMAVYGATGVLIGWLADRVSRRLLLSIALALWSFATAFCGLAGSFTGLVLARGAVGVGEAATVPVGLSLISDNYPIEKRPFTTSLFFAGGMVGLLVAFMLGSWLGTAYGWRTAFLVAGPPGLLMATIIFFGLDEPIRETAAATHAGDPPAGNAIRIALSNPALLWALGGGALSCFANLGIVQWLPAFFIRSHHMSQSDIGLFFGPVLAAGSAAGMLGGGWVGNRLASASTTKLLRFCAWSLASVVPLYLIVLLSGSLVVALVMTFAASAGSVVYSPCYMVAATDIAGPRIRAFTVGFSGFFTTLTGGALCPFVVGTLSDHWSGDYGTDSLKYALIVALVLFCGAAVGLFLMSARSLDRQRRR